MCKICILPISDSMATTYIMKVCEQHVLLECMVERLLIHAAISQKTLSTNRQMTSTFLYFAIWKYSFGNNEKQSDKIFCQQNGYLAYTDLPGKEYYWFEESYCLLMERMQLSSNTILGTKTSRKNRKCCKMFGVGFSPHPFSSFSVCISKSRFLGSYFTVNFVQASPPFLSIKVSLCAF